jgi:hypothetical protein
MAMGFARRGFQVHMMDLSGMGYSGANRLDQTIEELHLVIEEGDMGRKKGGIRVFGIDMRDFLWFLWECIIFFRISNSC